MSTPDQPSTPPLTRRQLRELRNTASTPIITPEEAQADADASDAAAVEAALAEVEHESEVAPERTPAVLADDVDLDPDAHPVTRRQARHLAKLRTGTVDVVESAPVTDEVSTGDAAATEHETTEHETAEHETADGEPVDGIPADGDHDDDHASADDAETPQEDAEGSTSVDESAEPVSDAPEHTVEPDADSAEVPLDAAPADVDAEADEPTDAPEPARVVAPELGAQLLADGAAPVDVPPSFDHLLTRGGSGSSSAPNALILSQTPETGSLSVPILGTGELIITGSYALPESFGSTGTSPGSDGKDADAALMDGELPPASSPTPIAASAAISTIKSADEIIRPPAPEKGSRLIMTLAICAGALGLALATVLIFTVVNGVF
ncbi:hypothetical protein OHB93_02155 [Microbacterium sp. No. 7]|uniref:hypothetical protein n=1 Tax=Microbacterium sp. No. 7 TaxID=1714373 RepID=UPI00300BEB74